MDSTKIKRENKRIYFDNRSKQYNWLYPKIPLPQVYSPYTNQERRMKRVTS